jgi:hypothetical protein
MKMVGNVASGSTSATVEAAMLTGRLGPFRSAQEVKQN